jgi:hypothetical protein
MQWIDCCVEIRDLTLNKPWRSFRPYGKPTIPLHLITWRDLEQGSLNCRCLPLRDQGLGHTLTLRPSPAWRLLCDQQDCKGTCFYTIMVPYSGRHGITIATGKSEWMHEYVSNHFRCDYICFHNGWRVVCRPVQEECRDAGGFRGRGSHSSLPF